MANIIIGTTPTIKYRFNTIDVESITTAYMTIKKDGAVIVKRSDPTVDENILSWTLTQEETLAIGTGVVKIMCNWLLADGTRGASHESEIRMKGNHIAEVI